MVCKRPIAEVGTLSVRGKCEECRNALVLANHVGLRMHTGPFFDHWRRQHAAAVGGVLIDELEQRQ